MTFIDQGYQLRLGGKISLVDEGFIVQGYLALVNEAFIDQGTCLGR
jgi:hypothetical protein